MKHDSTMKLVELLQKSSEDDLYILMEYNFEKGCTKVEIEELVRKIRYNGSNNIAYLYRKFEGVEYIEIVQDVAKKMKVKYSVDEDEEDIEGKILVKVLENWWKKLQKKKRKKSKNFLKRKVLKI